jgi:hypothetical protein
MDINTGIRENLHEEDTIPPWLFNQHQVWVDFFGHEHEIESMPIPHVEKAIAFCEERAERFWQLFLCNAIFGAIGAHLSESPLPNLASFADSQVSDIEDVSPEEWLASTPLMRSLKRRISPK